MIYLLFDCETTGLIFHPATPDHLQPSIIEWGGLLYDGKKKKELVGYNALINPGKPISETITKITGITDEDVKNQHSFSVVAGDIRSFFERADCLVAHNLPFDYGMMALELKRAGLYDSWPWPRQSLCTVQEHVEEWGKRPKLLELYEYYMKKPLAQTHRAIDDVRALLEICLMAGLLK